MDGALVEMAVGKVDLEAAVPVVEAGTVGSDLVEGSWGSVVRSVPVEGEFLAAVADPRTVDRSLVAVFVDADLEGALADE